MKRFALILSILILIQAPACRHSEDKESSDDASTEVTTETIIRNATRLMQDTMEPIYSPDNNLLALMTVHQKILDIPVTHDRTQLQGLTFVLPQASGDYIVDSTRVSAPANGSRFTLYETTVDGLPPPLVEIGYVDVSWTEQSDGSVTIEVKAVANSQKFISYTGSGKPQRVAPTGSDPRKIDLFQAANIDLAAGELSLSGTLIYAGRELDFEYFKKADYDQPTNITISTTSEWNAVNQNGQQAHYWVKSVRSFPDISLEFSFDLTVNPNTIVNFSSQSFTAFRHQSFEGHINDSPVALGLVERGTDFFTVAETCLKEMVEPQPLVGKPDLHKLMTPAMYSLLVVL